jgi:hypothetical protein
MLRLMLIRLLPIVLLAIAAGAWFCDVQGGGPWVGRNLLPLATMLLLAVLTLWRGSGRWSGAGWRLPLGTAGFALPAIGLTTYLHYAYAVNLQDMFGDPANPGELFRFLPWYTMVAGAVGFAIGWIIARNL